MEVQAGLAQRLRAGASRFSEERFCREVREIVLAFPASPRVTP